MKLTQKRILWGTTEIELIEDTLYICQKSLFKSRSHEITINGLSSRISKIQSFPLGWCVIASTASLGFFAVGIGAFFVHGDGQMGMAACALLAGVFAALAWYGFLERRVDFVILNSKEYNTPQVYIHRTIPSVRHVEEFVEIVKERIEAQKLL